MFKWKEGYSKKRKKTIGMDIIIFIAGWIKDHTIEKDLAYKEYLIEEGKFQNN